MATVARASRRGGTAPPGWTHDPTSWSRRVPLIALALAGLFIAAYLTLHQIGVLGGDVWDPVFGSSSSERILTLTDPVPDAAAGVLAYATEVVLLLAGGPGRWRTMPWTCLALGLVLCAGGAVSVVLVAVQAVVGAWCLLCLASAALSLLLLAFGIGEAVAAWQAVTRARVHGRSLAQALRGA